MPSIDERIVAMSFENDKFEAGVRQTMSTLDKLNQRLSKIDTSGFADINKAATKVDLNAPMSALDKLKSKLGFIGSNANQGFSEIDRAGNRVNLNGPISALDRLKARMGLLGPAASQDFSEVERASHGLSLTGLSSAIDAAKSKFSILSGAAAVAFGNIATTAIMAGARFVKAFTVQPIIDGFKNYETQINAVQTIMANTGLTGQKGIGQVNAALADLNKYANLTVYNFSEMTRNIGTFTAAGVSLGPAVESIKGIANLAAMSGSTSEQASSAMYQLSQAIAAGSVKLQDWNSVVNAGIGGSVLQKALANTAEAMGKLPKAAVQIVGPMHQLNVEGQSFRNSIQSKPGKQSWLTSDVLVQTLRQFTGDMSKAQLAAEGFSASQIKAIQTQAKVAVNAATQIKTLSQLSQALKEEVGTAWAAIFKTLFGNLHDATALFSPLHTFLENELTIPIYNLNKVLQEFVKLGGRTDIIQGFKNAWADLKAIITPIKDAFREIFPPTTARDLLHIAESFKRITAELKIGPQTADELKRTFAGLFAVLDIGKHIVEEVFKVIGSLLGVAGKGAGGFLHFTGSIGDFLVALDRVLVKGGELHHIFTIIADVLRLPITLITDLAHAIASLFSGSSDSGARRFGDTMNGVGDKLKPLKAIFDAVSNAWHKLVDWINNASGVVPNLLRGIGNAFSNFASIVANAFQHADYSKVFDAIKTVLIGGIFLELKKAFGGGGGFSLKGLIKIGDIEGLNSTLKAMTGTLTAMQKNIQAGTLLKIAAAIGILAAGIVALSLVDGKKLTSAMAAISIGLGELVGALALLSKFTKGGLMFSMPLMAGSLILLATSVTILAGAVTIFSHLSWEGMIKGLIGVAGALAGVALAMKLMPLNMVVTAAALVPLSVALNLIAAAVIQLSKLSFHQMLTGLLGMTEALISLGTTLRLFGPETLLIGPGLIAVSIAMGALAAAVGAFGHLKLDTLAKGILGIGAALVVIGLALDAMPPSLPLIAAGLVVLGVAMTGLAGAVGIFGHMNVDTIVKGVLAMGGALVVLAAGLEAMTGGIPGTLALLGAAAALAILAPVMVILGHLGWGTIAMGLGAIAAVLGTIAIVGALAAAPLAALGSAMIPLGIALGIIAGSAWLLSKAISGLSDTGTKAFAVLLAALAAFVAAVPKMLIDFIKGFVDVLAEIANVAPKVMGALTKILNSLIQVVINSAPAMAVAIGTLIDSILTVLTQNFPRIFQAGMTLLLQLLDGLERNIPKVVPAALKVVVEFLHSLASKLPEVISAGVGMIVAWLNGISKNLSKVVKAAANVVVHFLSGIAQELPRVVGSAANMILTFLNQVASYLPKFVKAGVSLIVKVIEGIGSMLSRIVTAGIDIVGKFLIAIGTQLPKLVDQGALAVIKFLNGIANAIHKYLPQLMQAAWNIAWALVTGFVQGLEQLGDKILHKIEDKFLGPIKWLKDQLSIFSPSGVTRYYGQMVAEGFAAGIDDKSNMPADSIRSMGDKMHSALTDVQKQLAKSITDYSWLNMTSNGKGGLVPVIDPTKFGTVKDKNGVPITTGISPIITTSTSTGGASSIANTYGSNQDNSHLVSRTLNGQPVPAVQFVQNNYSPEALPAIEIYRQTNNQLAQATRALGAV